MDNTCQVCILYHATIVSITLWRINLFPPLTQLGVRVSQARARYRGHDQVHLDLIKGRSFAHHQGVDDLPVVRAALTAGDLQDTRDGLFTLHSPLEDDGIPSTGNNLDVV